MRVKSLLAALCLGLSIATWQAPADAAVKARVAEGPTPAPTPTPAPNATNAPHVSLTLTDALQLALANNLTFKSAIADTKSAFGRVIQARGDALPSLSAGYSYVHTQNAATFLIPTGPGTFQTIQLSATDMNNVNATLQWAIYNGGKTQAAIGSAAAGLAGAEATLSAVKGNLVRDTTNAYFQLVQAQRNALIADQAVSVAQKGLDLSNQLFHAGTAARADVLKQQVALANAQVQDVQASSAVAVANAVLANLLNINLNSQISPTEPLETQAPTYSMDQVLESAQTKRPELAASQAAVAIAEHAVQSARAGALPAITLQVQDASSKPNFQNVPQPQLSETLAVTWKLFDGGLTKGKVVEAQANVDKANIQLQQQRNGVDLEARKAYLNYRAAQAQVSAAKSAQDSAAESLRVTQLRYQAGAGTAIELADAQLSNTQAQTQYVAALASLRIALVTLQAAAGLL